jgi:hypothetical protein
MTTNATNVRHLTFGHPRALNGIAPRARMDAGGTRLRLRALHVMGHGSARIARALSVREDTIQRLVRGDARTVSPQLRDAVADLYAGNWCAAAALNDNQLDTPGYRPRAGYRPATGTGVAADIRLPVRRQYKRKGA